jgi:hypothetical protein
LSCLRASRGLCGEEAALLAVPLEQRRQEQRERLGAIFEELNRIRDTLRGWADRIRADGGSRPSGPESAYPYSSSTRSATESMMREAW